MRLIDADILYDKAEERYKNAPTPFRLIYRGFVDDVADAQTVDAIPVVRCKDCKYYNRNLGEEKKTCIYLAYATHALEEECVVGEDDFCSRAEKKS